MGSLWVQRYSCVQAGSDNLWTRLTRKGQFPTAFISIPDLTTISCQGVTIGILKSNREKEEDLVATGIPGSVSGAGLQWGPASCRSSSGDSPVAPTGLCCHPALPSDPIRYGYKAFENCYNPDIPNYDPESSILVGQSHDESLHYGYRSLWEGGV